MIFPFCEESCSQRSSLECGRGHSHVWYLQNIQRDSWFVFEKSRTTFDLFGCEQEFLPTKTLLDAARRRENVDEVGLCTSTAVQYHQAGKSSRNAQAGR